MSPLLPIKKLSYTITSEHNLPLHPTMPTVTLRGAFGHSLVKVLAYEDAVMTIEDKAKIYQSLFLPEALPNRTHHETPCRPFVIRGHYPESSRKEFMLELLLFGNSAAPEALIYKVIRASLYLYKTSYR